MSPRTCSVRMSTDHTSGRTYTDDLSGMERWVGPSVTTVLQCLGDDGHGLHIWWSEHALLAGAAGFPDPNVPTDVDAWVKANKTAGFGALKRAQERGSTVHEAFERLLLGQPHGLDVVYDHEAIPYLDGLQRFMADHQPEPVMVEVPVFHRGHGYAGRIDCFARIKGRDGIGAIDLKSRATGEGLAARMKEGPQLAAYRNAEYAVVDGQAGPERVPLPEIAWAAVLAVGPDGTYALLEVDTEASFPAFLGALAAAPWVVLGNHKGVPIPAVDPMAALEQSVAAAAGDLDTVLLAWLKDRARWLYGVCPAALDTVAATWPEGVPLLPADPPPAGAQLDAICDTFTRAEAQHAVEFWDRPDPRDLAAKAAKAAEAKADPAVDAAVARMRNRSGPPPEIRAALKVAAAAPEQTDDELKGWIRSRTAGLPVDLQQRVVDSARALDIAIPLATPNRAELEVLRKLVVEAEGLATGWISRSLQRMSVVLSAVGAPTGAEDDLVALATTARTRNVDVLTEAEHDRLWQVCDAVQAGWLKLAPGQPPAADWSLDDLTAKHGSIRAALEAAQAAAADLQVAIPESLVAVASDPLLAVVVGLSPAA